MALRLSKATRITSSPKFHWGKSLLNTAAAFSLSLAGRAAAEKLIFWPEITTWPGSLARQAKSSVAEQAKVILALQPH